MSWTPEELEMFCLETYGPRLWRSTVCACAVYFDGPNRQGVRPCSPEHEIWAERIGIPAVRALMQKWATAKPPEKYRQVLAEYLEWGKGCPLSFDEKFGSFPHGKACREFAIKDYVADYQRFVETGEFLFFAEELLVETPMTLQTFRAIFFRDPDPDAVQHFVLENA